MIKSTTVNPLYNDTWYNDKIRYNDNLIARNLRSRVIVNKKLCKNIALKLQDTYVLDFCWNRLNEAILKYPKHMFYAEIRIKQGIFLLHIILSIMDSLQFHYNDNIFGNNCYRCNEGSL